MTLVINPNLVTLYPARIMTADVGVIHGSIDVMLSDLGDDVIEVTACYTGSDDVYEVEGSPVEGLTADHIINILSQDYGRDEHGNRIAATLATKETS